MSEHPGERLSEEERKAVLFELSEDDHLTRPGRDFDHYERLLARAIAKLERGASVSPSREECIEAGGHFWPPCDDGTKPPTCTRCGYNPGWLPGHADEEGASVSVSPSPSSPPERELAAEHRDNTRRAAHEAAPEMVPAPSSPAPSAVERERDELRAEVERRTQIARQLAADVRTWSAECQGLRQRLGDCEEALGDAQASEQAFREEVSRPFNEREAKGGSIQSLSWDELLGVAVRNLNMVLDQDRDLTALRARVSELEDAAREVMANLLDSLYGDENETGKQIIDRLRALLSDTEGGSE